MPSINLSLANVAINSFGLIITVIIFSACLSEWIGKKTGSKYFIIMLGFVMLALVGDIAAWICEGHPEVSVIIMISNTVASCSGQISIICFMDYLRHTLYENSKAASVTLNIFKVLCLVSLVYAVGNAFWGYSFVVSPDGHYVHSENVIMVWIHLMFSIMSFTALILMALFATQSAREIRVSFIKYTIFPIVGIIIDYTFHGLSLTYISMVISVLVLYTDIYLQRQKMIDAQRNALMLSQINPHFTYNTLSTIAAMCDTSPQLAKSLTIDFARYLRQNVYSMTSEQPISFEKELEHVECYLKIEKARFREKLNVIYSIQCKNFDIPPLTVQPIVENAIKHGITKRANGGTLKITTYSTEKSYVIDIIDDGAGFNTEELTLNQERHVGLENVESRVSRICRGTVTVKSTVDIGTRVTIEIPRKKGKKNEHLGS